MRGRVTLAGVATTALLAMPAVGVAAQSSGTAASSEPVLRSAASVTTTAPYGLLTQKKFIYGSEIGAWEKDGNPAVTIGIAQKTIDAGIPVVRFSLYDCFVGQTCGTDHHAGTITRTSFDQAVAGIVAVDRAVLWLKLVPIARDALGTAPAGTVFCPPWIGWAAGNLAMYKAELAEVRKVYAGPIIVESNNEMEYTCWRLWKSQGALISSAGSVGVSKRIGEHFAATMPALKAYARALGFSQVVVGGYVGIGGGTGWGQACTANSTKAYGYSCAYQARWISEFNTAVHKAYVAAGSSNPDYVPDFEAIHAYPHSADFAPSPYAFKDGIALAYYRNWITQSRGQVNAAWGKTIGDQVRFSISEWSAGLSSSAGKWSGWSNPATVQQFFSAWLGMLKGDGNVSGTGTRYWSANTFEIASNSDTGAGRYYNIIRQDGSTPAWYSTFKAISTTDPRR